MKQVEIFSNFLDITDYENSQFQKNLSDISLDEFIILRKLPDGFKIYYLHNGNNIFIPKDWIMLFNSYNVHSGAQARFEGVSQEDSKLDKIIYYFLMLISYIDINDGKNTLNILYKIFNIGVEDFREWFKKATGKTLEKIEFYSKDDELII